MSKKVIHVLGSMDVGGTETWLLNVLKYSDNTQFKHELIVHRDQKGYFDDLVLELGSKKHICVSDNKFIYPFKLYFLLRKLNPEVVHSHVGAFSGVVLSISYLAGVKTRISHSHNTLKVQKKYSIRSLYVNSMKFLINMVSTHNIAVSEKAAISLYGKEWYLDPRNHIMYCGIDYDKFSHAKTNINYRDLFKIPTDATVLGHVGSFSYQKNHVFLLKLLAELLKINNNFYLVLVGDGSLKKEIEDLSTQLGVSKNIRFTGNRRDIPEIMTYLFDLFLFPSHFEGLGLVAVEAQMAKLKVLASNHVPDEADCGNLVFIPLDINKWIDEICNKPLKHLKPNSKLLDKFKIQENIKKLRLIYGS